MTSWSERFTRFSEEWIPDPFILAIFLTVLTFGFAFILTHASTEQVSSAWYRGFFELLAFSMQMVLILLTGFALVSSPLIKKGVSWFSSIPRTPAQAVFLCGFIAMAASLFHWGFGLMVGAFLAREMGILLRTRGIKIHYPLLAASGYLGLTVWHGGLSGSAPLLVASKEHFLVHEIGTIPIRYTLGSMLNLVPTILALFVFPIILAFLHPTDRIEEAPESLSSDSHKIPSDNHRSEFQTPVDRFVQNPWSSRLIGITGFIILAYLWLVHRDRNLDLNGIIYIFLMLGFVLHKNLKSFLNVFYSAARTAGPIVLQFPFYGGIMGIMKYTPLGSYLGRVLIGIAGPVLLPLTVYISAGLINLFVPSGGGQWAVQGPIVVEAAQQLSIPYQTVLMAVAFGDEWTNLLQPFWALPLLAITGLEARKIMGYTILLVPIHALIFGGTLVIHGLITA